MKPTSPTVLAGILLVSLIHAPCLAQTRTPAAWRSDLANLSDSLTRLHMNFFAHVTPDDFSNAVRSLDASIPSLTDSQIRAALARLVAMGQDSHTYLELGSGSRSFPFAVMHFDDGWFLTGVDSSNRDKLGYKLTALGGLDAEGLTDAMAPYISHDNRAWLVHRAETYLALEDALNDAGLLTARGTVRLDLQAPDGSAATLELAAASSVSLYTADDALGTLPLYRQRPSDYYWYQYDADHRLLYVAYRKCAEQPGKPSVAFWQQVLDTFDENPVDRLVIDFRGNGGGDDSIADPLFNGFRNRITRFGNPTKMYGLTDAGTFSSALLNVSFFKEYEIMMSLPFVRVAGAPTGGNPNSFGNVYSYTLPASHLYYQLSTRYFGSMFKEESLQPDILVTLRSDQYFGGQDPVLEAVLADPLR